jgi:chromosome segregation ATPase
LPASSTGNGKPQIDEGEIRELRAKVNDAADKLQFAREKLKDIDNQVNELKDKVAQQDKVIAELNRTAIASALVDEVQSGNTEIKNALTQLSTYTDILVHALWRITAKAPWYQTPFAGAQS